MSISRPKRVIHRRQDDKDGEFNFITKPEPITWNGAVEGKEDKDFAPYSVKNTYTVGDLLMHPRYGKGVVSFVEDNKIDVLFEDGARKLAHGLG